MSRKERPAEARPTAGGWRGQLHEVIFEAETPAGRAFDVGLIGLILLSVLAVMPLFAKYVNHEIAIRRL